MISVIEWVVSMVVSAGLVGWGVAKYVHWRHEQQQQLDLIWRAIDEIHRDYGDRQ